MSFIPSEIQHAIDANDYAKAADLFDDEELKELQLPVQAVVSFFRQVATGAAQRVYCDIAVDKLGRYLGLDREQVLE
ncbi:hypothetical protein H632_c848p0, partial [Helicosporidium sp. ATCC 50920]